MKARVRIFLFSIGLFSASYSLRFLALAQTTYANGWDGYFYINQAKSFIEEGRMDVPDASLIYPLLIAIRFATDNYELAFKVMACLLAGVFSVSLFHLVLKWTNNFKAALILASFSLFSPHLTYFAAQYPKNLLGLVFFVWLLQAVDSRGKIVPLALLILNFFGHRVTAVLSFIFLLIHTAFTRLKKFTVYIAVLFAAVFLVAGFFIPGLLNLFDAERFKNIFAASPHFGPYSFVKTFTPELISGYWMAEIAIACLLFVSAVVCVVVQLVKDESDKRLTALVIVLSLLIFPYFRWAVDGPSFRFVLVFILLCPILMTAFLKAIRHNGIVAAACVILVSLSFFSYKSYMPRKHDPPYGVYEIIGKQINEKMKGDSCELIIAHKSLAEYIVYSTSIDAMSWLPEYVIEKEKLWRIAAGPKDIQFEFYLDPADRKYVSRLTPTYSFVREDVWQRFLRNVEKDHNDELLGELTNWTNPDRVRPYYLLKNKK
jgi:hypothetical protein